MKKIILAILAVMLLGFAEAQITWQKKNGPYGGGIKDIVVHSSGTVYTLADYPNQTIWRSTDNGNSWVEHSPAALSNDVKQIRDLKLAPDGTIYALASSNLYKTADNGTTWVKVNAFSGTSAGGFDGAEEIAINLLSNTIYVMGYHYTDGQYTVFRSTNGGVNWTKGYQGQYFGNIVTNTLGEIYAIAGGSQLWKSSNDGTTFTLAVSPVPADLITSTRYIAAKSNGAELVAVTTSNNMYTLSSPFTTWTLLTETGIADLSTYGNNANLLYSADNSTLFLFDNGNNKVYSRTTGSWTNKTTTFITSDGEDNVCAASFDINTVYVGTQRLGVHKTINGGVGWTEVNTGIENLGMRNMVVADNGAIIVAGSLVYRSTDDGQSWTKAPTACCSYYQVIKATTGTPKTLLLLAEGGGTSYKSTDNGANWTTLPVSTPNATKFVSPDGTKILGYSSNQLYYSANQGTTWSAALTKSGFPASFGFTAYNDRSVAMDQNGVIYSGLYEYSPAFAVKFYKITLNSITTPTTATATQIPFSSIGIHDFVEGVQFLNNKIYVLGNSSSGSQGVLSITSNAGSSWTPKSVPDGFKLDVDPINNYIFVTRSNGSNYTLNISRDDGTSFSSTSIPLQSNNTFPYGVSLNTSGVAFVGFGGSSVHKSAGTIVTPAPPTSLVNAGSAPTKITLQWNDNATNEQYYIIEKFDGSAFDSLTRTFDFYQPAGKGFIEIPNLEPATSYQFRVYAKNTAGNSSAISITTSTLESCVSDIPDNKSWSGNVNGTTTLTNVVIKKVSEGTYSVGEISGGAYSGDATVKGTFDYGCIAGSPKLYLRPEYPFYSNGNGTWNSGTNTLVLKWITEPGITPVATGTVTLVKNAVDPAPLAPTIIGAYAYSNTSIEVKWTGSGLESKFYIERKTGAGGTYAQVGTVNYPATSFIDNTAGLAFNSTYFYRVKAENGNVTPLQSPYSGETQILFRKPNFVLAQTVVNNTPFNSLGSIWADFNNDGFDDLMLTKFDFFSGAQTTPNIFQNNGAGDFTSVATNLDAETYANATAADYDNDGDVDLFYSTFAAENKLYSGTGGFTFTKISPSAVEEQLGDDIDDGAPFSASWVDYNNDGLLDLFVAHTGDFPSSLYKQEANHTFTKITTAGDLTSMVVGAFASAWADYDNDGDKDVFLIDQTSGQPNKLFKNNGNGTFTKVVSTVLDGDTGFDPQTVSWADFDNDQDMDLFVGGENGANMLYRNNAGVFAKLTTTAFDVTNAGVFSSNWADVNNDGFIDLLLMGEGGSTTLCMNVSGTSFTKVTTEKLSDATKTHLSGSLSDFNNDGFVDLFLASAAVGEGEGEVATPDNAILMKNNNTTGNWLKVRVAGSPITTGTFSNRSAIGAKVRVTTGSINQTREVNAHIGVGSQNSLVQHFGLGAATVATVVVTWPSGVVRTVTNVAANTTITVTEDVTGPAILSRTPSVSATNVPTNTSISITLNEASTAQAGKLLMLYLNSDLTTPILGIDVTTAAKSGDTYTFTLPSALVTGTQYNISVDAGAFVDAFGNLSAEFPTGLWSFTVGTGPVTSSLSPTNGAIAVAANTPLQITFDKNISAVAGKHLKIMDGATIVTDVDVATAGAIAGAVYTFTPSAKLPTNKILKVIVDAGAFKDVTTLADFSGIATDAWSFTIAQGPVVTVLSPLHSSTGIATTTALQITFDKNVTAVAGKKIKLMDGTTAVLDADVSLAGTVTNNVYSITPTAALPTDKILKVVVDADAFVDPVKQTSFAGIALDSWNFRTALAPDAVAPVITFTPPSTAAKGFGTQSPEITVTDDRGTVSSVVVHIRKITGASSSMVDVVATQGSGANSDKWTFAISEAAHFDAIGTEYFIEAKDPANNIARSPAGTATHKLYLTYNENESKIPQDRMGFGGTASSWKVFAIPFVMGANNGVTSIFNEFTEKSLVNKVDYRLLTIQSPKTTDWAQFPEDFATINRGQGYFINIKVAQDIKLGQGLKAPENSRENLFKINLKQGWNMVGNPYLTQISWDNVADFNSLTGQMGDLHKFNGSAYPVGVQTLDAYEGGFVFAQADKNDVVIPFLGQTTSGGRGGYKTLGDDINNPEWLLHLNVQQGDAINDLGSIGMAPDAKLSFDDYDGASPPRFINYLETNFAHPEHFAKRFTRDVVPTQNEYVWSFSVDSNIDGQAEIFWDNSAFANGAKEIFLFDETRQRLIDMRAMSSYSFNPKESVNFKVHFGDNLRIAPQTVLLGKAFPNPTSGFTNIAFSLPDSGGPDQLVSLEILDATGKSVGTVAKGKYSPGFYETGFNSKDLNNGFYTYRLTVQNSRGRNTLVNKLIIK